MSLVKCSKIGCPHLVRRGLIRNGVGVDGQELADGRFCWRCRAEFARRDRAIDRRNAKTKALPSR